MADGNLDIEKVRVETLENGGSLPLGAYHQAGAVRLLDSDHVVLVPTPSRDPKGESTMKRQLNTLFLAQTLPS